MLVMGKPGASPPLATICSTDRNFARIVEIHNLTGFNIDSAHNQVHLFVIQPIEIDQVSQGLRSSGCIIYAGLYEWSQEWCR